jgi:hypothetical protein
VSGSARKILVCGFACLSGLILAGCFLHLASGNVIYVSDIEEEVNEIITTVFSNSTATICLGTDYGFYECTYIIEGEIITSSLYLLSELGLFGVLIDPLILQVDAGNTIISATYDLGGGPQPLAGRETASFQVQPGQTINAEPGTKFFILDLPADVAAGLPSGHPSTGPEFDLSLRFHRFQPIGQPVTAESIKAMFAAKVVVNGHRYYAPLLPCANNFSEIPAVQIPLSDTPQNLMPAILAALQSQPQPECDHQAYYYDSAPPPITSWLRLPLIFNP